MPKENGPFFAVLCVVSGGVNAATTQVNGLGVWAAGYCAGGGTTELPNQCAWCNANQAPTSNCSPTYAGCVDNMYIAKAGEMLQDRDGNTMAMTVDDTLTMYKCTTNGWEKIESQISGGDGSSCDRYSYYNSDVGACLNCPNSGVFTSPDLAADSELLARGDNYQFLLTGCHYFVSKSEIYCDETGSFVFLQDSQCTHDGML